jgi:hypothetical protein
MGFVSCQSDCIDRQDESDHVFGGASIGGPAGGSAPDYAPQGFHLTQPRSSPIAKTGGPILHIAAVKQVAAPNDAFLHMRLRRRSRQACVKQVAAPNDAFLRPPRA